MFREPRQFEGRLPWLLAVGTLPIVISGLLLKKHIEGDLRSLYVVATALIVGRHRHGRDRSLRGGPRRRIARSPAITLHGCAARRPRADARAGARRVALGLDDVHDPAARVLAHATRRGFRSCCRSRRSPAPASSRRAMRSACSGPARFRRSPSVSTVAAVTGYASIAWLIKWLGSNIARSASPSTGSRAASHFSRRWPQVSCGAFEKRSLRLLASRASVFMRELMRISSARCSVAAATLVLWRMRLLARAMSRHTTPGKYPVKIDSAPPGAMVYINDKTCLGRRRRRGAASCRKGDNTVIIEIAGLRAGDASRSRSQRVAQGRRSCSSPLVKKADPPKIDVKADADPRASPARRSGSTAR